MTTLNDLDSYKTKYNTPYEAINAVSKEARNLLKSVDYHISGSYALSCAINDETPILPVKKTKIQNSDDDYTDILNYVEDEYVKRSVEFTLKKYSEDRVLSYYYHKKLKDSNRARVRILVNMIVDNMKNT